MPFQARGLAVLAYLISCAQNPIDLHSRAPQGSGNRGWTHACRVHRLDLLPVEPPLATSIHAISLRALNPLPLPLVEHCDESLPLIAVVHNVEYGSNIAPEPV